MAQNNDAFQNFILNITNTILGLSQQAPQTNHIHAALNRPTQSGNTNHQNTNNDNSSSPPLSNQTQQAIQSASLNTRPPAAFTPETLSSVSALGLNGQTSPINHIVKALKLSTPQPSDTIPAPQPNTTPDNAGNVKNPPVSPFTFGRTNANKQDAISSAGNDLNSSTSLAIDQSNSDLPPLNQRKQWPFFKNFVSKGSTIDLSAFKDPERYPDGDICFHIQNVTKKPRMAWSSEENGKKNNKKHYCLGVWVCPGFDTCMHRIRVKLPRRGSGKYNTGNKIPVPAQTDWCAVHKEEPILMKCTSSWQLIDVDKEGTKWKVIHNGHHNHPAPHPIHAKEAGRTWVKTVVSVCPKITTTALMLGEAPTRPGARFVDAAFHNKDHLKHVRRQVKEEVHQRLHGSRSGMDNVDASAEFVRQLKESYDCLKIASLLGGVSQSGVDHGPVYIFQGKTMRDEFLCSPFPHETDTIESVTDSNYYLGKVDITITSGFSMTLQKHIPYLVSILPRRDVHHYSVHWDHTLAPYHDIDWKEDINKFAEYYPGNTSDMSEGILGGWLTAMNTFVKQEFRLPTLPIDLRASMYGYCKKHFNSGVVKTASISKYVDPLKKEKFIEVAMSLPNIKTIAAFKKRVNVLKKHFPNTIPWLCWYLHSKRRIIIFKAFKDINDEQHEWVDKLSHTTNGQEGLGGFLKNSIGGSSKLVGNELLQKVATWVQAYEDALKRGREGHQHTYKARTRREKAEFAEKRVKYKAPDGIKLMDTIGNQMIRSFSTMHTTKAKLPSDAPPQLKNKYSCCFANALFQNVFASDPIRIAILDSFDSRSTPCAVYSVFQKTLAKMEVNCKAPRVIEPDWVLILLRHFDNGTTAEDYEFGRHSDPLELFSFVLRHIMESGHPVYAFLMEMFSASKIIRHCMCTCMKTPIAITKEWNHSQPYLALNHHTLDGCTVFDCLVNRMGTKHRNRLSTDTHTPNCAETIVEQKDWLENLSGRREKVLVIMMHPYLEDHSTKVPQEKLARPVITMDLTNFFETSQEGSKVTAELSGYISFKTLKTTDIDGVPHFVSITKSRNGDSFYLSDDLLPEDPKELGCYVNDDWLAPIILFYTIKHQSLKGWGDLVHDECDNNNSIKGGNLTKRQRSQEKDEWRDPMLTIMKEMSTFLMLVMFHQSQMTLQRFLA